MITIIGCLISAVMVLVVHIVSRVERKIDNFCDNHLSDLAVLKKECPLLKQ